MNIIINNNNNNNNIKDYYIYYIMTELTEQYLMKIYDDLQSEKNKLFNELKNDKELTKEKTINSKIVCIDSIIKNVLKYRNLKIKEKLKGDL